MNQPKKQQINEIVKEILVIKEELSTLDKESDDNLIAQELARNIQKLNILLISLSPYINNLRENVNITEAEREQIFTDTYLKEIEKGTSQKNAEIIARQERLEATKKNIVQEKYYRNLSDFKQDIERFIMGLNTRLSFIKTEKSKNL